MVSLHMRVDQITLEPVRDLNPYRRTGLRTFFMLALLAPSR
jgi:hypothetical protein